MWERTVDGISSRSGSRPKMLGVQQEDYAYEESLRAKSPLIDRHSDLIAVFAGLVLATADKCLGGRHRVPKLTPIMVLGVNRASPRSEARKG